MKVVLAIRYSGVKKYIFLYRLIIIYMVSLAANFFLRFQQEVQLRHYNWNPVSRLTLVYIAIGNKEKEKKNRKSEMHELRVQMYKLRIQIYEFRTQIHELRLQIHEL